MEWKSTGGIRQNILWNCDHFSLKMKTSQVIIIFFLNEREYAFCEIFKQTKTLYLFIFEKESRIRKMLALPTKVCFEKWKFKFSHSW